MVKESEMKIQFAVGDGKEEKIEIYPSTPLSEAAYGTTQTVSGERADSSLSDSISSSTFSGQFVVTGNILVRDADNVVRVLIGLLP